MMGNHRATISDDQFLKYVFKILIKNFGTLLVLF